ncbi:MAG: site-2 protease family protein [Xanthobacteraceae bacterium]|nr:MAG: site-2 protease family protein [Xanthobacteraceae bacterium]
MTWSLKIGTVAGTAVRVHVTFLLFLAWIFAASYATGGATAAWNGLVFMVLLFACVLLHEFGHIFTARAFGVTTPDVTLLPIGGVARLDRIPEQPREELLIAIAGPLVNVAIAIALIAVAGARFDPGPLASVDDARIPLVDKLAVVNLFLALFNMIPAFPMDGGRVLRAALAARLGFTRATGIAAAIGQGVAFLLGFLGLLFNPMLIFIAIFVYLAAASEAHMVSLRTVARGMPASAATITQFATLAPGDHIENAADLMLHTSQGEFPVVDGLGRLMGVVSRADVLRTLRRSGADTAVEAAMTADVPTIDRRRCLDDALRLMQAGTASAVAVTTEGGRLYGLITPETVAALMTLQEARRPESGSAVGDIFSANSPR